MNQTAPLIILASLASGCGIPFPYTIDSGKFCAMGGSTFCEIRERETGWSWEEFMNPCPKLHVISSRMSFYKTTYDLSAPGSAPVVSVAVSTDLDYMRGSGDPTVTLLRGRLGLPDNLTLKDADDRRFVAFNPGTLDGKEADSLRRVGFESGDMFGGDYWWDGPSGRLYLAFGEHGIGLYCPQTGLHRRRALSGNYGPIWDPANHRVAIVRTDLIHVEPPISVTIWDYSVDKVTTYPLRPSPG